MNTKHLALSAVIAVISLWSLTAIGEQTEFSKLDTNGDGLISLYEAVAEPILIVKWESVDTNQDGTVEPVEFEALKKHKQEAKS